MIAMIDQTAASRPRAQARSKRSTTAEGRRPSGRNRRTAQKRESGAPDGFIIHRRSLPLRWRISRRMSRGRPQPPPLLPPTTPAHRDSPSRRRCLVARRRAPCHVVGRVADHHRGPGQRAPASAIARSAIDGCGFDGCRSAVWSEMKRAAMPCIRGMVEARGPIAGRDAKQPAVGLERIEQLGVPYEQGSFERPSRRPGRISLCEVSRSPGVLVAARPGHQRLHRFVRLRPITGGHSRGGGTTIPWSGEESRRTAR